jgi:hypothetical protein
MMVVDYFHWNILTNDRKKVFIFICLIMSPTNCIIVTVAQCFTKLAYFAPAFSQIPSNHPLISRNAGVQDTFGRVTSRLIGWSVNNDR